MLAFLPSGIKSYLTGFLMLINLLFWSFSMVPVTILKLAIPNPKWRQGCGEILAGLAEQWIDGNERIFRLLMNIRWDIEDVSPTPFHLDLKKSYLVLANHQSWVDILILQHTFQRRAPFIRFFLKKALLYVPVLGVTWWALDYPFMQRHSKEYLRKNPQRRNDDFEATRRACEKFKSVPVSILNFAEGTRFSVAKRDQQNAGFKNLLSPKSGGVSFVLQAMGEQFEKIIDVTIFYPQGPVSFGEFLGGKLSRAVVRIRALDVPIVSNKSRPGVEGVAISEELRFRPQEWIRQVWQEKDDLLEELKRTSATAKPTEQLAKA